MAHRADYLHSVLHQRGMTLIECLAALAISAMVLSGLMHVIEVGVRNYTVTQSFYSQSMQAQVAMRRIMDAVSTATQKKTTDLVSKDSTTSGDWFYGTYGNNSTRRITYAWSPSDRVLNEIGMDGIPVAILDNVTSFSVTAPYNNSETLVEVDLTLQDQHNTFAVKRAMRLGGPW